MTIRRSGKIQCERLAAYLGCAVFSLAAHANDGKDLRLTLSSSLSSTDPAPAGERCAKPNLDKRIQTNLREPTSEAGLLKNFKSLLESGVLLCEGFFNNSHLRRMTGARKIGFFDKDPLSSNGRIAQFKFGNATSPPPIEWFRYMVDESGRLTSGGKIRAGFTQAGSFRLRYEDVVKIFGPHGKTLGLYESPEGLSDVAQLGWLRHVELLKPATHAMGNKRFYFEYPDPAMKQSLIAFAFDADGTLKQVNVFVEER